MGVPKVSNRQRLSFWLAAGLVAILWSLLLDALNREAARIEQFGLRMVLNQLSATLVVKSAILRSVPQTGPRAKAGAGVLLQPRRTSSRSKVSWYISRRSRSACKGSSTRPTPPCAGGSLPSIGTLTVMAGEMRENACVT